MTEVETRALCEKVRKADKSDDQDSVESLLKELALGALINLARIADHAGRKKEKRQ